MNLQNNSRIKLNFIATRFCFDKITLNNIFMYFKFIMGAMFDHWLHSGFPLNRGHDNSDITLSGTVVL